MTTSLVTGGAGFIGSHVCDHLIRAGHKVVVLDDLSGGSISNLPQNDKRLLVEHWGSSITNSDRICDLFNRNHFDYVYHLAAYASEGLSHHIRHHIYENNVLGSVNLINVAVQYGVKRFIFTSSVAVYGHRAYRAVEYDQLMPIDPYGIAKMTVEMDLWAALDYFGLSYTIFRPHNVYGERQNLNDPYRNVVGIFMRQALAGEPFTIYGDGLQTRSFTYVDDVAPLIANCVNLPHTENETYNVGSDVAVTVLELAQAVATACGVEYQVRCLPKRVEAQDASPSHRKAQRHFDLKASTSLQLGLSRMAQWAKTQPKREVGFKPTIEVEKNLPSAWKDKTNA